MENYLKSLDIIDEIFFSNFHCLGIYFFDN
jgi:hypothetical protein